MDSNNNIPLEVRECDYKGEHYSAREDGMVMRHHRNGMPKRKLDDVWICGKPNPANGYLFIGSSRVHIIVAMAFHGVRDSKIYVVDHIDTNRQNNRPENLRWLTRLENVLLNEITRKKIELICGSIEAFLENPSLLYGYETEDKNFIWMKKVTKEEAWNCLENWRNWARTTTATHDPNYKKSEHNVGEWIYEKSSHITNLQSSVSKQEDLNKDFVSPFMNKVPDKNGGYKSYADYPSAPNVSSNDYFEKEYDDTTESLTPSARQRNWRIPTEFPFCPESVAKDGLQVYLNNLREGEVFSENDRYDPSFVVDKGMSKDDKALIVLTTNPKENDFWAITAITIENNKFVHENNGTRAGEELTKKVFKYMIGQGELTDEEFDWFDALN